MVGFTGFQSGVFSIAAKGQKKVEMIFSSRRFLQKMKERILLYYYETSGGLLFIFWRKLKTKNDISKLSDLYNQLEIEFCLLLISKIADVGNPKTPPSIALANIGPWGPPPP